MTAPRHVAEQLTLVAVAEQWIAQRLRRPDLFAGLTTPEERRERVRREILGRHMDEAIAGRAGTPKVETWHELFERVYGEPLQ